MSADFNNNILKKWLDKLQEESWNLELLISGFSIFGLFKLSDFFNENAYSIFSNDVETNSLIAYFQSFYSVIFILINFCIFFLLIHIIFRGLWVGAIGIRYVSGEIDYHKLKYNKTFTGYLKKKVGSFDNYILKLEKVSSLIFGYTFLIIFILFSSYIFIILASLVVNGINYLLKDTVLSWLPLATFIVIMAIGLVFVFDFFTIGLIKKIKNKRISKLYLFINRVTSIITLSFIWKPLYYNIIDKKSTRWLIYLFIPFFILTVFLFSIQYNTFSIIPSNFQSDQKKKLSSINFSEKSRFTFSPNFYDNLRDEYSIIEVMSLPNNYQKERYMQLFVKLYLTDQKSILHLDSTITKVSVQGMSSTLFTYSDYEDKLIERKEKSKNKQVKNDTLWVENGYKKIKRERNRYRLNLQKILNSAKKTYNIKINNSTISKDSIDILFHKHKNNGEEGFLLIFPINTEKKGFNMLTLEKSFYHKRDNQFHKLEFSIPFIYEN